MSKTALRVTVLSGISIIIMGSRVHAEATPNQESASVAHSSTLYDQLSEKATLSYSGVYRGASLGDIGNSLQPAVSGDPDPKNPQSIENTATMGYKLNPDLMVGITWHFYFFPVGGPGDTGQNLQMWDPSFVVAKSNLINQNGYKLTGKFLTQLPFTSPDNLKPNNLAAALIPTFIFSYDIPHTRLSVGAFAYIKYYVPTSSTLDTAPTYKINIAPNANYQLTKTLAATLWIDLIQATRCGGTGLISGMSNATPDIEPGISWDIAKNVMITPMINFYPSHPTLAATSLQAILTAKAF